MLAWTRLHGVMNDALFCSDIVHEDVRQPLGMAVFVMDYVACGARSTD